MESIFDFFQTHIWVFKILLTVVIIVILHVIFGITYAFCNKKITNKIELNIVEILYSPIIYFLWLIAIIITLDIIGEKFEIEVISKYIVPVRNTIIIVFVAVLALRWKAFIIDKMGEKKHKLIDESSLELIGKVFSIIIIFVAIMIVMQLYGLNIMPLLTFGGIGVAAVGLASKDVISNFFGGMMLHITKPFKRGEFINIPKADISGTIEHIGWYLTAIRDTNKSPVYVPNSMFAISSIKNISRTSYRRFDEIISIRYKDFSKIGKVVDHVRELLTNHKDINKDFDIHVYFSKINEFSLDLTVKAYTNTSDYGNFMKIQQDVLVKIYDLILKDGADAPFPTTTVEIKKD